MLRQTRSIISSETLGPFLYCHQKVYVFIYPGGFFNSYQMDKKKKKICPEAVQENKLEDHMERITLLTRISLSLVKPRFKEFLQVLFFQIVLQ